MDTSTIIWIVVIVGAMIFNSVSKVRKARQKGENPPSQHGEAWPSIPWDEEERPAAGGRSVESPARPRSAASEEPVPEGPKPVLKPVPPRGLQMSGQAETASQQPVRTDSGQLPKLSSTLQKSDDRHLSPASSRSGGDYSVTQADTELFPDECQSLEEIPFEEYTPELIGAETADLAGLHRSESSLGSEYGSTSSDRSGKTGRELNTHPKKQAQNRAGTGDKMTYDSVARLVEEFDLRRAVIYSEILKPKFEEE